MKLISAAIKALWCHIFAGKTVFLLAANLAETTAGNYRLQFIKVLKHMSNFN